MSSSYFAKRVSWGDGYTETEPETAESEYLIGGRTRGIEGHLKGGGSGSKSPGFAAFFTHLSFLGILVISALLINSLVNSVHDEAYEILSIVGVVVASLVCVSSLMSLCGLYQFDSHHTRLLLTSHLLTWAVLLMQVAYGGLITAYWGARAMPDILMTSPDASPTILLATASSTKTSTFTQQQQHDIISSFMPPVSASQRQQQQRKAALAAWTTRTIFTSDNDNDNSEHLQQQQRHTNLLTTQSETSPIHTTHTHSVSSRPLIGILSISAVVTLAWCVMGLSAVNWPGIIQLRVIKLNATICALILLGIGLAIETLGIWTLVDTPAALEIAYDDVSSWAVYGALVSAFFTVILSILLMRLLCIAGQEQELDALHTRLTRRSAATSSSSTFAPVPTAAASSSGLGSGVRSTVGFVSTRAEHNAVKHQKTLSSLHTVMFFSVLITAAIVTFSAFTYDCTLPTIDEEPKSELLLTSSILGFAAPVFNFLTFVTCYLWRRRILDSNDSDIYSKHSHIYEPIV